MRELQNDARKIISFFQTPSLKYAAWGVPRLLFLAQLMRHFPLPSHSTPSS